MDSKKNSSQWGLDNRPGYSDEKSNTGLLNFITNSHGSPEQWNSFRQIEVNLWVRGNLLAYKGISPLKRKLKVTADTKQVKTVLDPFPMEGYIGLFEGDIVSIQKKDSGETISELHTARNSCKTKKIWNNLNLLYFLGYAFWNYINTPYFFHWKGFQVKELGERKIGKQFLQALEVIFPDSAPSHCKRQVFYFGSNGLLQRLDYSAEIFGSFLTGAHICKEHKKFNGFFFPTHRIVYPRFGNYSIPFFPPAMEGRIESIEFIK